ncbi:hypothetical protein KIW84_035459 [Lathyrus oleraceus]|uniref:Reverse transcriptase domain-containing protein n=1 Tax=Pisum sativum TaxID=3888 RepID=A0A9D5B2E6_PEA|nr:hypothetical protein KIW84_035459 [Pisum sativum]
MPHCFHEHKGFIRGRGIRDCISLTSEMDNWLHRKTLGGNTVLKVDTTKAFDTLSWNFIVKVASSGIFWNDLGDHLDNFRYNLGSLNALFAELMGAVLATEATNSKNRINMWLETDSL